MDLKLFIDNLPQSINSQDLRRFFSNHGQLADAYVPHIQRRRAHGRFGFIEVISREQGDRVILEDDGKLFGHQRIRVQWARYPKRSRRTMNARQAMKSREQSRTWRSTFQAKVAKMSDEFDKQSKVAKVVKLDKVNENLGWLGKSLTCISDVPRDVEALRIAIQEAFPEKILVRDLGKYKFLLTVESQEIKEKLKTEGEECLKQWFSSVADWAEDDACQTRRLWLEMVGIPIHLWSEQNIKRIAGMWGDVLYVEKDTAKMASFASAKAVIDTLSMYPIEDEAIIQVEHVGYRIPVFEAKTEFTIFHVGPVDEDIQPSMEAKCSQREEDEDSRGEVAVQTGVAHKEWSNKLSQGGTQNDKEEQQSLAGKIISISSSLMVPEVRQPRSLCKADPLLQIEDAGYTIVVSEAGSHVQFKQSCKESTNEECPGLEDFHENMATITERNINNSSKMLGGEEAVQESEDIQKNSKLDPGQGMNGEAEELAGIQNSNKAAQEVEGVQNYSNLEPIRGPPNGSPAGSECSVSRTRTACFSCNVNSEECISTKKAQRTSAIKDQQVTTQACVKAVNEKGDQGINEDSSSSGPPPGFECAIHTSGVVVGKNGNTESSSYSSGSTDREAREALRIGELVGLKIVKNKEAAVSTIKRTLRSNRKRVQQSQEKLGNSKKTNKTG